MSKAAHPLIVAALAAAYPEYKSGLDWDPYPVEEDCGAFAHAVVRVTLLGESTEFEVYVRATGEMIMAETGNVISTEAPALARMAREALIHIAAMEAEHAAEYERRQRVFA